MPSTEICGSPKPPVARRGRGRPRKKISNTIKNACSNVFDSTKMSSEEYQAILLKHYRIRPASVTVEQSSFRIALVDSLTNIIQTEAIVFLQLFQSRKSPCIYCPKCQRYMSVRVFGTHFHLDSEDESGDEETKLKLLETLRQRIYHTLPCLESGRIDLTEQQVKQWNIFIERVSRFKVFQPEFPTPSSSM